MELRKQRGLDAKGDRGRRLRWLSNMIVASGLKYEPKKWILYLLVVGATIALFGYSLTHNPLIGLGAGLLVDLVAPYAPKGKKGRPPFAVETMLRVHFMQQWFTLSDPAMKEAFHDVPLFGEFVSVSWDGFKAFGFCAESRASQNIPSPPHQELQ